MVENISSSFFISGFIVYMIGMIVIAYFTSRSNTSGEDYLMGGRNLGFFLLISTLVASAIGTGSSIGGTADGFRAGFRGSVFGLANSIGFLTLGLFFVQVRKFNFRTISEEVQYYYNGNIVIRKLMGVMMYAITLIWVANHINGGSKYLGYVTGVSDVSAKLLTVAAFAIYVFIGGYMAVVWTDAIQTIILLIGFILITIMAIPTAGGFEGIRQAYETASNSGALTIYGIGTTGLMGFFSLVVAAYWGNIIVPAARMRIYTARTQGIAQKSMFMTALIVFLFSFLPAMIGMSGFTIAQANSATAVFENPDFTFHYMATTVLGPAMGLLFLIAGLSATMSSADSEVIAGVTVLLTDIYSVFTGKEIDNENIPKFSKIALVITLIIAFLITLTATDVIGFINSTVGAIAPGVGICIILGRFWKRVTWQGGIASVAVGFLFGLSYLLIPSLNEWIQGIFQGPAIPVTIFAFLSGIIVSLITPKMNRLSDEKILELVLKERPKETLDVLQDEDYSF